MKGKKCSVFFGTLLISVLSMQVQAGIFGEGLSGAFQGAFLGRMIDGRDGAAAGAIIGGLIGAGEAAHRNKKQKEQQAEMERRQAQWTAQKSKEQDRINQQQALVPAKKAPDNTLVVETQKSLIRLGYEPGDIGVAGPALDEAVSSYQKSQGLLETGELSQALLTHMLRNGG